MQSIANSIQQESVCAWCRSEYDRDTGERLRKLTDAEYSKVKSHGICLPCREEQTAIFKRRQSTTSK